MWKHALEQVHFERIKTHGKKDEHGTRLAGELGGTVGWKWLAGLTGKFTSEYTEKATEEEVRERILADPSPAHLIPVLQQLPYLLVFEDFHYLKKDVQVTVFQQWKAFVDDEVSVIIVGTTHHSTDLAHANKDLVGRVRHIDMGTWSPADLEQIVTKGFAHLKVAISDKVKSIIAAESAGLPIITQAVCFQICSYNNIDKISDQSIELQLSDRDVYKALHAVAKERYSSYAEVYERLKTGPRKAARRYDSYEYVLMAFTLPPVKFSLSREELTERLKRLPVVADMPPESSITSTLDALKKFQQSLGIEILEWSGKNRRLYMLEPSFLFYLRWRKERTAAPSIQNILRNLIVKMSQEH